ncbi:MAG: excinuclease ABC subunit UvrC [Candidatus Jidaibacter sp.]|jgi:excinuclease ABC subunit C|nr:excinuclease ABC subunit UvrC [Candidatus Jidaibacter sp.]
MKEELSGIQKGVAALKAQILMLPSSPGIYKMLGEEDRLLYIGKAKSLVNRVASYADINKLSNRIKMMVSQIRRVEFIITNSEAEALLLEANLINKLKPTYNVMLKDDKSFPYIFFDESHEYPRLTKYRGNKSIKGKYYGPFASVAHIKQTIIELQKMFLIRPCSNSFFASRTRPCIQYEIKRCSGPCVRKIESEEYRKQVRLAKLFLEGDGMDIHKSLISEMEKASAHLEFEKAAAIRDKIKILSAIQAKNVLTDFGNADIDIIGTAHKSGYLCIQVYFIRSGKNFGNKSYYYEISEESDINIIAEQFLLRFYEAHLPPKEVVMNDFIDLDQSNLATQYLQERYKSPVQLKFASKKNRDLLDFANHNAKSSLEKYLKEKIKSSNLLLSVAKLFNVPIPINRIEIYDNSHVSGTNAVGCMVVYSKEGFDKKQYRKYNIKSTNIGDDYAMLEETLTRRLSNLSDDNKPDLIMIDGGAGHLTAATEVFTKMQIKIPFVCIAKGRDRNAGREFFHLPNIPAFQLSVGDHTLHFLQILRDEVHNYALKSHRQKRSKEIRKSSIDEIPGVGLARKKALLQYFGSAQDLFEASLEDISKVSGISKIIAKKIFNYLHTEE